MLICETKKIYSRKDNLGICLQNNKLMAYILMIKDTLFGREVV